MKFKVGDIVKGIPDNGYSITNGDMYKGEVVNVSDDSIVIKILDHKSKGLVGKEYPVVWKEYQIENNEECFELISLKKPTKEELLKMPIGTKITTNKDEDNIFVKISDCVFENNDDECVWDTDIEEDLSITDIECGDKIIKIEVPTYKTVYDNSEEIREMTMDEICKALGYNVKIVKEEN